MTKGRRLKLEWSEHREHSCLRVYGWTESELRELGGLAVAELRRRLALLPSELLEAGLGLGTIQPIAGCFELDQDSVCFLPRFPFLDGMSYSLLVNSVTEGECLNSPEVWAIQRLAPDIAPTTEVVRIYPSADQLPVNQLKLYAYFSSPMSEGWVDRAVQVRRADNCQPLEGVFLAMEPELWDTERCRLTLLLDPGRIKRGLAPNIEAGYPLIEGVPIIVTIGQDFRDASGLPLCASMERRYEIGPLVRTRVSPADWRSNSPAAGTKAPLIVEFDRPLDYALLQHSLQVNDAAGLALAGEGSVGPGERFWRFLPESPWQEGQYLLLVAPRLEDLAGNSVLRVFDRDLMAAEDAPIDVGQVALNFTCAPTYVPLRDKSP